MLKIYLVLLSLEYERPRVKELFDADPELDFWFYSLPSSVFVRTEISAEALSAKLVAAFGEHKHFVTEVSTNRAGRLPKSHWPFFRTDKKGLKGSAWTENK